MCMTTCNLKKQIQQPLTQISPDILRVYDPQIYYKAILEALTLVHWEGSSVHTVIIDLTFIELTNYYEITVFTITFAQLFSALKV
jgi:hypothetical protein